MALSDYNPINALTASSKLKERETKKKIIASSAVAAIVGLSILGYYKHKSQEDVLPKYINDCGRYQPLPLLFSDSYDKIFTDKDYQLDLVSKLQGAVKIPTEVYDFYAQPDLSVPLKEEPLYGKFAAFHDYLEKQFPLVHKYFKKEIVNGVNLVFTLDSKKFNVSGKPLLLMAHQDVVPVNTDTIDRWTYPPFDGVYEPETGKIYGRGSSDTKKLLIGEMAAAELLLSDEFDFKRPLIIAFGFDEEKGGEYGAKFIAQHLLATYGKDGIEVVLDEGGGVSYFGDNGYIAQPGVAEKGYVDIEITLNTLGGHSSAPNHWDIETTGIGLMSEVNVLLTEDPFPIDIALNNPILDTLQCSSKYKPETVQPGILKAIKSNSIKKLTAALQKSNSKFTFKTTQAIDIIKGGIKSNAMPEQVINLVNHRINIKSSVLETLQHDLKAVTTIADKYDVGISVDWNNGTFKTLKEDTVNGGFIVKVINSLEPVPRTPVDGIWDLIAGTFSSVYLHPYFSNPKTSEIQDVYFEGSMNTGNTDTKYYSEFELVSGRIYRFSGGINEGANAHTVDEWTTEKSLVSVTGFFYAFIGNFNGYADKLEL
ncbi:hypothetical protein QEN19_000536 [Hanseniaspora menglaensis]